MNERKFHSGKKWCRQVLRMTGILKEKGEGNFHKVFYDSEYILMSIFCQKYWDKKQKHKFYECGWPAMTVNELPEINLSIPFV